MAKNKEGRMKMSDEAERIVYLWKRDQKNEKKRKEAEMIKR